jgi:diguanylate cyclase (GGDEF)-like protein
MKEGFPNNDTRRRPMPAEVLERNGATEREPLASESLRASILRLEKLAHQASLRGEGTEYADEVMEIAAGMRSTLESVLEEEKNSRIDFLTGLPNRRAYTEAAAREVALADRELYDFRPRSLFAVRIDLDYFKQINDTFGHDAGDLYLKTISKHMQESLRATDFLARVGGDEFSLLLPGLSNEEVEVVCRKLHEALRSGALEAKEKLAANREHLDIDAIMKNNISGSIGVALYDGILTVEELDQRADQHAILAKIEGKDRIVGDDEAVELDPDGAKLRAFQKRM